MKVAIINKEFFGGGAATACRRLLYALKNNSDIEVSMLVQNMKSPIENVHSIYQGKYGKFRTLFNLALEKGIFWFYEASRNIRFSFTAGWIGDSIISNKIIKEADIIHLHWINHGFISLHQLKKILALGKPIVWTLHDLWPFTGGCHYPGNCNHYLTSCGNCPMIKKKSDNDLSNSLFEKKKKISNTEQITWVGCSQWMVNELKGGGMLKNANAINIPNPIDTNIYKPLDKLVCKERFSFPVNKKIILFGAAKLSDTRKGMIYLVEAIKHLYTLRGNDFILVTFGKSPLEENLPVEIRNINYITDESSIVALYNAADLLVVPSLEDNLPNTIMESLSCGTPVVAFNTGGIPEMVSHLKTGYLAKLKDAEDLAKGMDYILSTPNYIEIQNNAREKVSTEYSEDIIAKSYTELYQTILTQWKQPSSIQK